MEVRHEDVSCLCAWLHGARLLSNQEGIFMSGTAVAQPLSQGKGFSACEFRQTAAVLIQALNFIPLCGCLMRKHKAHTGICCHTTQVPRGL